MSAAIETPKKFVYGELQGTIALSADLKRRAAVFAAAFYKEMEACEFCGPGDGVETYEESWVPQLASWIPAEQLRARGFIECPRHLTKDPVQQLVLSLGIDQHQDFHGPILCLVLHNDGLKFKQGKAAHVPKAGDWFVFNDLQPHGVKEAKGEAVWVSVNVPLQRIGDGA